MIAKKAHKRPPSEPLPTPTETPPPAPPLLSSASSYFPPPHLFLLLHVAQSSIQQEAFGHVGIPLGSGSRLNLHVGAACGSLTRRGKQKPGRRRRSPRICAALRSKEAQRGFRCQESRSNFGSEKLTTFCRFRPVSQKMTRFTFGEREGSTMTSSPGHC